jgi:hypothetical protein
VAALLLAVSRRAARKAARAAIGNAHRALVMPRHAEPDNFFPNRRIRVILAFGPSRRPPLEAKSRPRGKKSSRRRACQGFRS